MYPSFVHSNNTDKEIRIFFKLSTDRTRCFSSCILLVNIQTLGNQICRTLSMCISTWTIWWTRYMKYSVPQIRFMSSTASIFTGADTEIIFNGKFTSFQVCNPIFYVFIWRTLVAMVIQYIFVNLLTWWWVYTPIFTTPVDINSRLTLWREALHWHSNK